MKIILLRSLGKNYHLIKTTKNNFLILIQIIYKLGFPLIPALIMLILISAFLLNPKLSFTRKAQARRACNKLAMLTKI